MLAEKWITLMTIKQREALKKLIERHTVAATATKETARLTLIRQGIYTVEGRLTPDFGGRVKKKVSAR